MKDRRRGLTRHAAVIVLLTGLAGVPAVAAQSAARPQAAATRAVATSPAPVVPAAAVGSEYVIGTEDVLGIVFWRDESMSADVVVRPDGKISLPLLQDVQAAGMTPDQLRARLEVEAKRFVGDPSATVIVKEIRSRKVYITGQVARPGPYPMLSSMTVLQLIATAGGLLEYADRKRIMVVRAEGEVPTVFTFNHEDFVNRRNLRQNILLKPGDTVVVP